jgi:hypothetical protein
MPTPPVDDRRIAFTDAATAVARGVGAFPGSAFPAAAFPTAAFAGWGKSPTSALAAAAIDRRVVAILAAAEIVGNPAYAAARKAAPPPAADPAAEVADFGFATLIALG